MQTSPDDKHGRQQFEADFDRTLRDYIQSLRLLRIAAARVLEQPKSKRHLDAVLRTRIRETAARRAYRRASRTLFEAVLNER